MDKKIRISNKKINQIINKIDNLSNNQLSRLKYYRYDNLKKWIIDQSNDQDYFKNQNRLDDILDDLDIIDHQINKIDQKIKYLLDNLYQNINQSDNK